MFGFPIPVPVNTSADFSVGVMTHMALPPPGPPATYPFLSPSVEVPATQLWPPGNLKGDNELTDTVKHHYLSIVQKGHNCGLMIPDITTACPPNLLYPLIWPRSSREMIFSASKVKMDGKPTAAASSFPPLPMMTCGSPMSRPTALVHPIQLLANNAYVGVTFLDVIMEPIAAIAKKIAGKILGSIFGKITTKTKIGEKIVSQIEQKVGNEVNEYIDEATGGSGWVRDGARNVLSSLSGDGGDLHTDNPTKPEEGAPTANEGISQTSDGRFKPEGGGMSAAESSSLSGDSSFGEALP